MTLLKRRILRIGAVSGAALLAASCAETQLGAQAVKEVARSDARTNAEPQLAPDAFDATGLTIWDGASTLEGVWIAHPLAQRAQRVRVTNLENQIDVEGAMFRRDPTLSGPSILVSSDAARLLGLQPGVPTELRIIALREGVYAPTAGTAQSADGAATGSGASDVETTTLAAPEPQESEAEEDLAANEVAESPAAAQPASDGAETEAEAAAAPAQPEPAARPAEPAEPTVAAKPAETSTTAPAAPAPSVRERERPKTAITAADLRGETTVAAAPANPAPAQPAPAEDAAAEPAPEKPVPEQPAPEQPAETAAAAPAANRPAPEPAPKPAQPQPAQTQPAQSAHSSGAFQGQLPKGRFVQAGAFGVEPNAATLVQTLKGAGLPAQYVRRDVGGSVLNIVMIGPLADEAAADAAIAAAAKAGAPGARKVIR